MPSKIKHRTTVFDTDFYRKNNPDLHGKSDRQLVSHYMKHGKYEGRLPNALSTNGLSTNGLLDTNELDVDFYRKSNPDLHNKTDRELIYHYRKHGKYEGRLPNNKSAITNILYKNDLLDYSTLGTTIKFTGNHELVDRWRKYPDLFNNYLLTIKHPLADIFVYKLKENIIFKDKILSIHCYKLENIDMFFRNIIQTYSPDHHIIITFTEYHTNYELISNIIQSVTLLQIPNKGADIGGKLITMMYLLSTNISFKYCLFVHSKSDNENRNSMLLPFIHSSKYINELITENNVDIIVPDFHTFNYCKNTENMFTELSQLFGFLGVVDNINFKYNFMFNGTNTFVLSYKYINSLKECLHILYNHLNAGNDFDNMWFNNANKSFDQTIQQNFARYKTERSIGNAWESRRLNGPSKRNNSYEHLFERIWITYAINTKLNHFVMPNNDDYRLHNTMLKYKTDTEILEHYIKYGLSSILLNPTHTPAYNNPKSSASETSLYKQRFNQEIYSPNNDKNNIVVFDMKYMSGGAYIFLENIICKYSNKYNFIIIRETTDSTIHISLNDAQLIKTNIDFIQLQTYLTNLKYDFIFINSLATQSNSYKEFINTLTDYKIGISHDFSLLYNEVQPINISKLSHARDESYYNLIITQNEINNLTMKLNTSITCAMPDYIYKGSLINTNNNKIHIAVIGAISVIKGCEFYNKLWSYFIATNLTNKYDLKIIGYINGEYGDNLSMPYNDMDEFNRKLLEYKPNIILEASRWPETWSYTLTLAKTTTLPILFLEKPFSSVINNRLIGYHSAHSFTDISSCLKLINSHHQPFFYTVNNQMAFPRFYESLFSGNYIENIIVITSKIIVSNIKYSYVNTRSIYTSEERLTQTLDTINSIKTFFNNKYFKIVLVDNSIFTTDQLGILTNNVDIFIGRDTIDNIDYETDVEEIKGFGEAAQMNEVNKYIEKNNISFKNLFKISGRYLLNNIFNYEQFNNNKNNFKLAAEVIARNPHVSEYYYTSLFKISYNYFHCFVFTIKELLCKREILGNINSFGYEQQLPKLLNTICNNTESFKTIDTLGLTQNISVWNKSQYGEQLNI